MKSRIFYITARQLTVYHWDGKALESERVFSVMADGQRIFSSYLEATPDVVSTILVDVVEEEFRAASIPHMPGWDGRAVRQRKLAQAFRETPYRTYQVQGRESTGRKDDQVLLAALTNSETLSPWMPAIDEFKVPLAGIYSFPMLAQNFLKQLKTRSRYSLLITEQENRTLRQTFLSNGKLNLSRLVSFSRNLEDEYASFLKDEVEKFLRYLHTLRLLPFGETLDVYVVCHSSVIESLREEIKDNKDVRHHFTDINYAAEEIGLTQELDGSLCEALFVRLLATNRPALNYADTDKRRYYFMHQFRKAIVAASIFVAAICILWSGLNVFHAMENNQLADDEKKYAEFAAVGNRQLNILLPKTPASPLDMQAAVEANNTLRSIGTSPYLTMAALSQGLNQYPQLQLDTFQWISSLDASAVIGEAVVEDEDEYLEEEELGYEGENAEGGDGSSSKDIYQITMLEGQLTSFNGDYPAAFAMVNEFVNVLRRNPDFVEVTTVEMPLDVAPSSTLSGVTGAREQIQPAKFVIKTVLRVEIEKV